MGDANAAPTFTQEDELQLLSAETKGMQLYADELYADALPIFENALLLHGKISGAESVAYGKCAVRVANLCNVLAEGSISIGDFEVAKTLLDRGTLLMAEEPQPAGETLPSAGEQVLVDRRMTLCDLLSTFSSWHRQKGDVSACMQCYQELLVLEEDLERQGYMRPEEHSATTKVSLSAVLLSQNEVAGARYYAHEARILLEKSHSSRKLSRGQLESLVVALHNEGVANIECGNGADGVDCLMRAFELAESVCGPKDQLTLRMRNSHLQWTGDRDLRVAQPPSQIATTTNTSPPLKQAHHWRGSPKSSGFPSASFHSSQSVPGTPNSPNDNAHPSVSLFPTNYRTLTSPNMWAMEKEKEKEREGGSHLKSDRYDRYSGREKETSGRYSVEVRIRKRAVTRTTFPNMSPSSYADKNLASGMLGVIL
jgi:hypothetical protein